MAVDNLINSILIDLYAIGVGTYTAKFVLEKYELSRIKCAIEYLADKELFFADSCLLAVLNGEKMCLLKKGDSTADYANVVAIPAVSANFGKSEKAKGRKELATILEGLRYAKG